MSENLSSLARFAASCLSDYVFFCRNRFLITLPIIGNKFFHLTVFIFVDQLSTVLPGSPSVDKSPNAPRRASDAEPSESVGFSCFQQKTKTRPTQHGRHAAAHRVRECERRLSVKLSAPCWSRLIEQAKYREFLNYSKSFLSSKNEFLCGSLDKCNQAESVCCNLCSESIAFYCWFCHF